MQCGIIEKMLTHRHKQEQNGFTLIELLVVIAIIGLLASTIVIALSSAKASARDAKRKTELNQVRTALEFYYNNNGSYPSTGGAWWGETPSFGSHGRTGALGYAPNLAPDYVVTLPHDQNTSKPFGGPVCGGNTDYPAYLYNSNGTDYKFIAHCLAETIKPGDPFIDPVRPSWGIGVWSAGASSW